MKNINPWIALPACIVCAGWLLAQEQPNPKTLIPAATLSYQHIVDLAGSEHESK